MVTTLCWSSANMNSFTKNFSQLSTHPPRRARAALFTRGGGRGGAGRGFMTLGLGGSLLEGPERPPTATMNVNIATRAIVVEGMASRVASFVADKLFGMRAHRGATKS